MVTNKERSAIDSSSAIFSFSSFSWLIFIYSPMFFVEELCKNEDAEMAAIE